MAKLGLLEDPAVGLTPIMASNIDIAYSVAYGLGQFLWGMSADRFGPRRVVLGGMLASSVVAVAMGLSSTVVLLGVFFFVQGLCESTGWAPLTKNMGFWFSSKERGRVMGFWCTNYAFGGMLASPFAGYVAYSVFDDWRWAFFSGAAVLFLICIPFYFLQRDRPRDVGLKEIEEYHGEPTAVVDARHAPGEEQEGSWELIGKVIRSPPVLVMAAAYFLLKPARYAILFWGPVIASERIASDSFALAAALPAAFQAAGLVAPIAIGFVSDKLFQATPLSSLRAEPSPPGDRPSALRAADQLGQQRRDARRIFLDRLVSVRSGLDDERDSRRRFRDQEGCGNRSRLHQRVWLVRSDPGCRAPGLPHGLVP